MKWLLRNILPVCALASGAILLIEGYLYFYDQGFAIVESIYCSVQNCAMAFAFEPALFPGDISGALESGMKPMATQRSALYIGALFAAPACSLVVIFQIAQLFLRRHLLIGRSAAIVFGYNQKTEALMNQKNSDMVLCICTSQAVEKSKQLELLRKKCIVFQEDYAHNGYEKACKQIPLGWRRKAEHVFFVEENEMDNFSIYMSYSNGLINEAGTSKPLSGTTGSWPFSAFENRRKTLYVCSQRPEVVKLIELYHDKDKDHPNLPVKAHDTRILNLELLRARKLFEAHPVVTFPETGCDSSKEEDQHNVHVVIVGYNDFANQAIRCIANEGVVTSTNVIQIDVIDGQAVQNERLFKTQFAQSDWLNDEFDKGLDGTLKIRFHKSDDVLDIGLLSKLWEESPITYIIICTEDMGHNMEWALHIDQWLREQQTTVDTAKIHIAVKTHPNVNISSYVTQNEQKLARFYALDSDEATFDMESICSRQMEADQMNANYWYVWLDYCFARNRQAPQKDRVQLWDALDYEKKESNVFAVYHQICKKRYLTHIKPPECPTYTHYLWSLLEEVLGAENMERLKNTTPLEGVDSTSIAAQVQQSPVLYELLAAEHRRWCYFALMKGYQYGTTKDEGKRTTPYLVRYENLCIQSPFVIQSDMLMYTSLIDFDGIK